jgi:hypothetical protein
MLINNSYVSRFEEKTAAAVDSAFGTIAGTMVFIFSPAAVGILGRIRKVDMAFWDLVGVRHCHAWGS